MVTERTSIVTEWTTEDTKQELYCNLFIIENLEICRTCYILNLTLYMYKKATSIIHAVMSTIIMHQQ